MAIEIVDFPIKIVIFHSYVKLPEGNFKNEAVLFGILGFVGNLEHSGRIRYREILVSVVWGNFEPGWFA